MRKVEGIIRAKDQRREKYSVKYIQGKLKNFPVFLFIYFGNTEFTVAHAYNTGTWEVEAESYELKANLAYMCRTCQNQASRHTSKQTKQFGVCSLLYEKTIELYVFWKMKDARIVLLSGSIK